MLNWGIASGIIAYSLFCMQFVLAARPKFLERIFGLGLMFRAHIYLAAAALVLSFVHKYSLQTIRAGASPAFASALGGLVLALFCAMFVFSFIFLAKTKLHSKFPLKKIIWLGDKAGLRYDFTKLSHNLTLLLAAMAGIHAILAIPASSNSAWKYFFITLFAIALFAWMYHKYFRPSFSFTVAKMEVLGARLLRIGLKPATPQRRIFSAGQFAYLRIHVPGLEGEWHPFTISSAPHEGEIQFTIKVVGDWTMRLYDAAEFFPGPDGKRAWKASLDFPYGKFTLENMMPRKEKNGPLVFIAGGIGINPFLSMLASLARKGTQRKILVLWAAGTNDDLFCLDALTGFMKPLPGLSTIPVLSSDPMWRGQRGFIDEKKLEELAGYELGSDMASWWLCCPQAMREPLVKILKASGVKGTRIRYENFYL